MKNTRKLGLNVTGRDLVVGDVHGCYDLLLAALREAKFNTGRDRLFCVGDTVDRGPDSPRALGFLNQPWVYAVRGNHEDMFMELYAEFESSPPDAAIEYVTSRNGMRWWRDVDESTRQSLLTKWRTLPIAMEVETRRGTAGLVHADVPQAMSWGDFTEALDDGNTDVIHQAMWGRGRLGSGDASGVDGIGRVFVGHTPVPTARRLGNVYYVDTGAVFGVLKGIEHGGMTVAQADCATGIFDQDMLLKAVNLLGTDEEAPTTVFGSSGPSPGSR